MKSVNNYLKNVTKSIAYTASDVIKEDLMPNSGEFLSTNKEFLASTYAAIKNPKAAAKKQVDSFKESKYYQAIDYGARNIFDDLKTGKWYNKEREDNDSLKFSGMDVSDWNDLSEYGIDDDWESKLNSDVSDEVTSGDMKIVESIEGSNRAATNTTVNAIAMAADTANKNSRVNTGILYNQNERLFGGIHSDISILNATLDSIHKVTTQALPNIDKNLADFFSESSKLNRERNQILSKMLELQTKTYKTSAEQEENNNKKKNKIRWSDINRNGMPDIGAYLGAISKNIKNETNSKFGIMDAMGDDSNMLAAFLSNPGKLIMQPLMRSLVPATMKMATREFDNMISSAFGTMIGRFSNARNEDEGGLLSFLSKFLGITTGYSKSIDSSKYFKGAIPFDGITKKAIVEVIPTYLRQIQASINGTEEKMYDYDKGAWTTAKRVKDDHAQLEKNAIRSSTQSLINSMSKGLKAVRDGINRDNSGVYNTKDFDKAVEEFREYLFYHNGDFNPRLSKEKNGIYGGTYQYLNRYYDFILSAYLNYDVNTKDARQMNLSSRMISNEVLDAKESLERQYRDMEKASHSIYAQVFAGGAEFNKHGKFVGEDEDKKKFKANNLLLNTQDNLGNTIFNYLQRMTAELQTLRMSGGGYANRYTLSEPKPLTTQEIKSMLTNEALRNSNLRNQSDRDSKNAKQADRAQRAIGKDEAIDIELYESDPKLYMEKLTALIAAQSTEDYAKKLKALQDENIITRFMSKEFYDAKSIDDIEKAIDDLDEETNGKSEEVDKNLSGTAGLLNRFKVGMHKVNSIIGAPAEIFTNLLYTADRAIYDMMFKAEIKDDDDPSEKHKGFMDLIANKVSGTIDKVQDKFNKDVLDPIKKRLGIDDNFEKRFKDTFTNIGGVIVKKFIQANKDVYSSLYEKGMAAAGIDTEKAKAERERREKQAATKERIVFNKSEKNRIDDAALRLRRNSMRAVATGDYSMPESHADLLNTVDQRRDYLLRNALIDPVKVTAGYYSDDAINKAYFRHIERTHAAGTNGKPFTGFSTLHKGEALFNSKGMGIVDKTGVYHISDPTHILNEYDTNTLLGIKNDRSKSAMIRKDLQEENSFKNKIFSHAGGTDIKTSNNVDKNMVVDEAKKYVPEGLAGGIIGAVASSLLGIIGGPLTGAIIGSGASILGNSDTLKDNFFGVKNKEGKREGGKLINAKIMGALNKYGPDMGKFGMAGIIPGLLTPLGPIGGILVGSTIGFLKNNETFMTRYFGEVGEDGKRSGGKLKVNDSTKDIIKKLLPGAGKGAAAGAAISLLFGGPFGILGNAAIGSAVGMMSTTDEFKDMLFGTKINGVRTGGLAGALNKVTEPLMKAGETLKDKLLNFVDSAIVDPLNRFIDPFVHEIPHILTAVPRFIMGKFEDVSNKLGRYLNRWVLAPAKDFIGATVGAVTKPIRSVGKAVWDKALSKVTPSALIGSVGDKIRAKQIREHRADYMSADERLAFSNGVDISGGVDTALAGINSSNLDFAKQARDALMAHQDSIKQVGKQRNDSFRSIQSELKKWNIDGIGLSDRSIAGLELAIQSGDKNKVAKMLNSVRYKNGIKLSDNDKNNFLYNEANGDSMMKRITDFHSLDAAKKSMGKYYGKDGERLDGTIDSALTEAANQLGINPELLKDGRFRNSLIKNLNTEITRVEANGDTDSILSDETQKQTVIMGDVYDQLCLITGVDTAKKKTSNTDHSANPLYGPKTFDEFKENMKDSKLSEEELKHAWENKLGGTTDQNINKAAEAQKEAHQKDLKEKLGADLYDELGDTQKDTLAGNKRFVNNYKNEGTVRGIRNAVGESISYVGDGLSNLGEHANDSITQKQQGYDRKTGKNVITNTRLGRFARNRGYNTAARAGKLVGTAAQIIGQPLGELGNLISTDKLTAEQLKIIGSYDNTVAKVPNIKIIYAYNEAGLDLSKDAIEFIMSSGSVENFKQVLNTLKDSNVKKFINGKKINTAIINALSAPSDGKLFKRYATALIKNGHTLNEFNGVEQVLKMSGSDLNKLIATDAKTAFSTNAEEPVEKDDVKQNGIGTLLLGGAKLAGKAVLGAGKALFNGGKKAVSAMRNKSQQDIADASDAVKPQFSVGGLDEVDDPNDGKDVVVNPQNGDAIKMKRGSDGSVEPDTADSKTKSILNKLALKEKLDEKLKKAQLKAAEFSNKIFSDEQKGGKKLKWWELLLGGLIAAPFIKKIYDSAIKPLWEKFKKNVWENKLKPWISDKWNNSIKPWVIETAIPTAGKLIGAAISGAMQLLISNLPGLIKDALGLSGTLLDMLVDWRKDEEPKDNNFDITDHDTNEKSGVFDESGNELTYGDLQNGNFSGSLTNAQGNEITVDLESGTAVAKANYMPGTKYAKTIGNGMAHAAIYKSAGIGTKQLSNLSSKLLKSNSKIGKVIGLGGKAITMPLDAAASVGKNGIKGSIAKVTGAITSKANNINTKVFDKVSDITMNLSAKSSNAKFADKMYDATQKATDLMNGSAGNTIKTAAGAVKNKVASGVEKVISVVEAAVEKLFGEGAIASKLGEAAEVAGETAGKTSFISKLKEAVIATFKEGMEKAKDKYEKSVVSKALGKVGNFLGKFAAPITFTADFLFGCDQAESILGVSDTSIIEEVIAGIINALCNFLILPSIIPGTSWIAQKIYSFLDKDLSERQAAADKEYEKYKEDTHYTGTKEQYLEEQYSFSGKVKAKIKGLGGKAVNGVKNIGSKIKDTAGKAVGAVKDKADDIISTAKDVTSNFKELFSYVVKGDIGKFAAYNVEAKDGDTVANAQHAIISALKIPLLPVTLTAKDMRLVIKGIKNVVGEVKEFGSDLTGLFNDIKTGNMSSYMDRVAGNEEDGTISTVSKNIALKIVKGALMPTMLLSKAIHIAKSGIDAVIGFGKDISGDVEQVWEYSKNGEVGDFYTYYGDSNLSSVTGVAEGVILSVMKLVLTPSTLINKGINMVKTPIQDLLTEIASLNDNNDSIIEKAKSGSISLFSKDYWSIGSSKTGIVGGIETIYNGTIRLLSAPSVLIANIFNKVNEFIDDAVKKVEEKLKGIKDFLDDPVAYLYKKITKSDNSSSSNTKKNSIFGGGAYGHNAGKYGTGGYDKQIDPSISSIRFNAPGDTEYQTIGDSGCGPAAAVSAVRSAFGRGSNDVVSASKYAISNGYKEKNGGTKPGFFKDYFNKQGLSSSMSYSKSQIAANIASGKPTVLMGQDPKGTSSRTPYGTNPHYVTVTGTDGRGNAIVQDPESKYDNQLYKMNALLNKSSFGISAGRSKYGMSKYGRGAEENAKQIWSALISQGYSEAATAGILGNLQQESGLDPSADGAAIGLFQFEKATGNANDMMNYASSKGKNWTDIQCQIEFAQGQLAGAFDAYTGHGTYTYSNGTEVWWPTKMSLDDFKKLNDPEKAAEIFCRVYERGSIPMMENRKKYARDWYNKLKGTVAGASSGSSDSSGNTSDSVNGLIQMLGQTKAGKALSAFTELITGSSSNNSNNTSGDSSGSTVNKSSGATEQATSQMEAWAADESHGYSWTNDRYGNPDFDCSGSVIRAWEEAGVPVKTNGASYTGNMKSVFTSLGFQDVGSSVNLSTGEGLQRGDVLLNEACHTGMWTGSGVVQASISETGGTEGQPGDQTGKEMYVTDGFYSYPWDTALRYSGGSGKYGRGKGQQKKPNPKVAKYKPLDAYMSYANAIKERDKNTNSTKNIVPKKAKFGTGVIDGFANSIMDTLPTTNNAQPSNDNVHVTNNSINYTALLNVVIEVLSTIADNTDKLNAIVSILNEKLGTDISASEVSKKAMDKTSIKSKLKSALLAQQKNAQSFNNNDPSLSTIINAMNAIASE